MAVIDMQVHVWEPERPDRPWDTVVPLHRAEPFRAEDLLHLMPEAGVDRAVLVPPMWVGFDAEYCLEAAQRWPERFGVLGRLDLTSPDAAARLAGWIDQPGMLGIRFTVRSGLGRQWLDAGVFEGLWPLAERLGIPVALYAHGALDRIEPVAARHPGLKLILDHLALPVERTADPFAGLDQVLGLARYPNVYVKVSSLPHYSAEPYPFRDLHLPIRRVYDAFGPRRMMWGSDQTRVACSYRESVNLFAEACDFLGEEDRSWILGGTAAKVLRWP